jgi:putative ABC transport system permease protein
MPGRLHRFARALLRATLPRDLRDAVVGDLDDERREQRGAGMTTREADRWAARQAFGSLPAALRLRLMQPSATASVFSGGDTMHGLWQDVRYSARLMRKHPLMTCAAIGTLALGIGATTAIFSVVHAALLRELPFHQPERLVSIYESFRTNFTRGVANPANFDFWERHATSFSHIAAMRGSRLTLTGAGDAAEMSVQAVMPSFFDTLGVWPAIGRRLTDADAAATASAVLISDDLWRTRFAADPDVTARNIVLSGSARPVAGVMPPGFRFPHDTDLWEALSLPPEVRADGRSWFLGVVARLKPGVSVAEAQAEMHTLAEQLRDAHPARQKERGAWVIGLHEDLVDRVADGLKLLQGAVALVLLIAIANVANLLLAHSTARDREFAIRTAVGASRLRLLRQLLTESLMLGLCGGAAGSLLAVGGVRALVALSPLRLPPGMEPAVDGVVLAFTLGIAVLASVLFGVAPALIATRLRGAGGAARPIAAGGGAAGGRFRAGLVIAEVALAVVLLVGAGLLLRSFGLLMSQEVGFAGDRVLTATTTLPNARYDTPERRAQFWDALFTRLQALPGVTAAGGSTALPFSNYEWQTGFTLVGREDDPVQPTSIRTVHPGYFQTLGVPILSGRGFDARDGAGGERAVIVNDTFARTYLSGLDPIGQRVRFAGTPAPPPAAIVGVAGDTRHYRLTEPPAPEVYRPLAQQPPAVMVIAIRTAQDPRGAVSLLRAAVRDIDPDLPVEQVLTMDALVARTVADRRFYLTLMGFFSLLALGLALLGVYSVMAYVVGRRTREIGVRLALGASPRQVRRTVLGPSAVLVAAGLTVGVGAALLASRVLESLLFGVTPTDPATIAMSVMVLAVAALAAAYLPARRAGRLNPAAALRQD